MFAKELYSNSCFKIRAADISAATEELKTKWEKVISDCQAAFNEGRDASGYRKSFCQAHVELIDRLSAVKTDEQLIELYEELCLKLSDSSFEKSNLAKYDAYCYAHIEVASLVDS